MAGISDALCRLYARTREEAYLAGALAALRKERTFPDYMGSWLSEPWARGPLGIGLGRRRALGADEGVTAELEAAWEGSPDPWLGVLAGGLAGRAEFGDACRLALGSSVVGARRLPSRSVEGMRLRRLVDRLGESASGWGPDLTHIGLLAGITGTGYELLAWRAPMCFPRFSVGRPATRPVTPCVHLSPDGGRHHGDHESQRSPSRTGRRLVGHRDQHAGLAIYDFRGANSLGAIAFLSAGIGAALFTAVSRGGEDGTPRAVSIGAVVLLTLGIVLYAIGIVVSG